ncbi:MAG TPA: hypothetical protein VM031_06420, partial [Phycisphaerae bacterium]|nr:hypothetical protein [Phycisphaerae bacterium]
QAAQKAPLYVGWATADITPARPVALVGQMHLRVSKGVDDPLTATALAIETRTKAGKTIEQAIMVSCDLCITWKATQEKVRQRLKLLLEGFDVEKLFLNATHTHTAPQQEDNAFGGLYDVSKVKGAMKASEYREFLTARLAAAAAKAWKARAPGGMSWALGQAVVGHNRRAAYFNGRSQMYGNTNVANFDRIEGYEDHGLCLLFFFNGARKLTGMVVNVACPSQETEGMSRVSADFWHDVRQEIRKRHGKHLAVLAQCSAAGDLSPHLLFRKRAEQIMLKRKGISRRQEIALRIADAIDRVLPDAKKSIEPTAVFRHEVARVKLPVKQPRAQPFYRCDPTDPIEFHVLRLGETALATNPFELYLDYGVRIKARSKAVLTFVVQLSCANCGYLPTARAVKGGGYSADKYIVGPKGGQVLVNETVKRINALWKVPPARVSD